MLFKLLEDSRSDDSNYKPTHFAVIFDSARKNFRNDIYSEYKANRTEAPEDLVPQFEYIRKSVKAFNLPSIELLNYEADDLIATYAKKIIKAGAKVTVISSDKDLMQLVSDNIRLYDPMKSKVLGEKEVIEKFGVKPHQVIDVQSLAGDSSDNIPGVPGIGIKTASELINKYKTLDILLKKADEIPQNKRRETLLANKDKAFLSRQLVTLKDDVPVKDDLSSFVLKEVQKDKLYDFLKDMEFNRLLSRVISFYGAAENKKIEVQQLLFPLTMEYSPSEVELLVRHKDSLSELGLELELFGKNEFLLRTVPAILKNNDKEEIMREIVDMLPAQKYEDALNEKLEEILIMMSCRNAIKVNMSLNLDQIRKLISDLQDTEMPYTCPHGRPIALLYDIDSILKKFLRK